jgi:hypothetical protein
MSKITYHKNCIRHEAVSKTKRMLNKIDKQFGGFQRTFWCDIKLTGVDDIDQKEVKRYIENHLKDLKRKIEKQLLRNEYFVNGEVNEDYEEGYYIPPFSEELKIIEALNKVGSFIRHEYPKLEVKKTEYVLRTNSPEEKLNETKLYFKNNPVSGFCQEYFAVLENGESKRLYPLTISSYDFQNAKSVRVEFFSAEQITSIQNPTSSIQP